MTDVEKIIKWLEEKKPLAAMLAPSFPIMYPFPTIITMLKRLGFSYFIEVAAGAKRTNEELAQLLDQNPEGRYITSPCPTIVRMIKKQMPEYAKYFTTGVDSPMVATTKIVKEKHPDHLPVFIGPCLVKKLEASEDRPELGLTVITYTELQQIFDHFGIKEETDPNDKFDLQESTKPTRIYPMDGGLSHSSVVPNRFREEDVRIVSGWKNCLEAIKEFDQNPKIRLLDILFCEGGCIGGPGIRSPLTLEERKQKILEGY